MGTIEIKIEPHELVFGETTIYMQGDPTAGKEWDTLMETPYAVGNRGRETLIEALTALAQTPEDAKALVELNLGGPTVNLATELYIGMVTGFPTRRQSNSTKSSKKTGGT